MDFENEQVRGGDLSQEQGELNIRELWHVFLENLWIIVLVTVTALIGAFVYIKISPVIYASNVVLMVNPSDTQVLNVAEVQKQDLGSIEMLNTVVQGLKNTDVIRLVMDEHKLYQDPRVIGKTTNKVTDFEAIKGFSDKLNSSLRRFTRLIDLSFENEDPVFARDMAQAVAEAYLQHDLEYRLSTGSDANSMLVKQAAMLKQKVEESEKRIDVYLRTNSVAVVESENIISAGLKELSTQATEAKTKRLAIEADWKQIEQIGTNIQILMTLPSVLKSPQVSLLKEKVAAQEAVIGDYKKRYKDKHPKMIGAKNALVALIGSLSEEVVRSPGSIELQYQNAKVQEQNLEQALREHSKKVSELNQQRIQYKALKRVADSDQAMYETVLKRLGEVDVTAGIAKQNIRIFEKASTPLSPIKPRKLLIVAFALFVGFGGSVGLVWLLHQLDKTIRSVDQAERLFGVPVLGAIPTNKDTKDDKGRLLVNDHPSSLCAESFRTLRASICLLGRMDERKVVLFTSAVPSEGKTFCCSNYAVAFAQQGKKTIVIDFDLRKPSVGQTFAIERGHKGVTDWILGQSEFEKCIYKSKYDNLDVMPAGTMVPNPSELLAGPHAEELIDVACQKYEHVIIDNAPINAVSDTLLLLRKAQTVCIVTRAGKTSYRLVQRALEMVRRAGSKPSGLVLNFVPEKGKSGYYYYYYSGKEYGTYGDSYGASNRKESADA